MNKQLDEIELASRQEYEELEKALILASSKSKHRTHAKQLKRPKKPSIYELESFIIIMGDTYNLRDKLISLGFYFNTDYRIYYKKASYDAYLYFSKEFESNMEIGIGYAQSYVEISNIIQSFLLYLQDTEIDRLNQQAINNAEWMSTHELVSEDILISSWLYNTIARDRGFDCPQGKVHVMLVRRETPKAYLLDMQLSDGKVVQNVWIAKSQINN